MKKSGRFVWQDSLDQKLSSEKLIMILIIIKYYSTHILFRITVEAAEVDKRMVLEHTHGLFIT